MHRTQNISLYAIQSDAKHLHLAELEQHRWVVQGDIVDPCRAGQVLRTIAAHITSVRRSTVVFLTCLHAPTKCTNMPVAWGCSRHGTAAQVVVRCLSDHENEGGIYLHLDQTDAFVSYAEIAKAKHDRQRGPASQRGWWWFVTLVEYFPYRGLKPKPSIFGNCRSSNEATGVTINSDCA